jgi:hypothetical protein
MNIAIVSSQGGILYFGVGHSMLEQEVKIAG